MERVEEAREQKKNRGKRRRGPPVPTQRRTGEEEADLGFLQEREGGIEICFVVCISLG